MKLSNWKTWLTSVVLTTACLGATSAEAFTIKPIADDTTGFKNNIQTFQNLFVQPEGFEITDPSVRKIDPNKLTLATDYDVRMFFLNEGAGKRTNQLKFSTDGNQTFSNSIFGDITCRDPQCELPETNGNLEVGDWVSLGNFKKGTNFSFVLETINSRDSKLDRYQADANKNPDNLDHLVAYEYNNYLVFGFEDTFGEKKQKGGRNEFSDRDFNDIVFVVDLPVEEEVPEPSAWMSLGALGLVGLVYRRRKKQV
ncbi:MAG: DUF4114 domain-containing protein [Jaaginema sp. PMC 1079.18]|nr:DUF4114 domain-containing protein [Jaaginema sp. PMC 1080.18]MEC4851984.1 DUF4114 domain-containing protein [Jaaginema sp. PMC 1079.18]MEC4868680.1 DUF4114 domain-containing protein [Jaaginema sp. PMC 1078.18]